MIAAVSATLPATSHVTSSSPKGRWLVGHFRDFRNDPLGYLTACARNHGDAVPLNFVGRKILLLSDPALIGEVLLTHHKSFRKHAALRQLARPALGDGLLLSEGDAWQRQRQRTMPAFRGDRIAGYAQVMVEHTQAMCATWQDGQVIDVHAQMMALTSRIVTRALFGSELFGSELSSSADDVGVAMELLSIAFKERMDSALRLPLAIPTPANRRYVKGMTGLDTLLRSIIESRRQSPPNDDLLGSLLAATTDDGQPAFTDQQLRDQVATLFFAGHETTANSLSWTHWLLATHPDVLTRLESEVDAVLGGRSAVAGDVSSLRFCGQVIDESMRLMPPVWVIGREATESVSIGGRPVARGTTVLMSQWVVHRDARWFIEPDHFMPERWADDAAQRLPSFVYFPFGGGPRTCIGNHFARLEMILLLATMVSRQRLSLTADAVVVPLPSLTLRPKHGIRMVVATRTN